MLLSFLTSIPKWLGISYWLALNEIVNTVLWFIFEIWWRKVIVQHILLRFNFFRNSFIEEVKLDSGIAVGQKWSGYTKFESIQYASAKRFQPPQKLPSSSTRVLNLPQSSFPQNFSIPSFDRFPFIRSIVENTTEYFQKGYLGSEDEGHQLNIWTPSSSSSSSDSDSDSELKPVIVVWHGGAYTFCGCPMSFIDGTSWAKNKKYVVVTPNYRLSALGYFNHPDMDKNQITSNCGLLDQICALRWVQENIQKFGGDPNRVTCGGESSGAMSTSTLAAVKEVVEEKLFHKMLLFSGGNQLVLTPKMSSRVYFEMALATGFLSADKKIEDESMVLAEEDQEKFDHSGFAKFLHSLSTKQIVDAQTKVTNTCIVQYINSERSHIVPFAPCIDHRLLFKNPVRQMKDVNSSFPTFAGTTNSEWTIFAVVELLVSFMNKRKNIGNKTESTKSSNCELTRFRKRIRSWLSETTHDISDEAVDEVVTAYLHRGSLAKRLGNTNEPGWTAINSHFGFNLPIENLVNQMLKNNNHDGNEESSSGVSASTTTTALPRPPCFIYTLSNLGLSEKLGTPHVADLPFFFDQLRFAQPISGLWTPSRVALKDKMMNDVDNFMRGEYDKLWTPWTEEMRPVYFYDSRKENAKLGHEDDEVLADNNKERKSSRAKNTFAHYYSGLVINPDAIEVLAWKPIIDKFVEL